MATATPSKAGSMSSRFSTTYDNIFAGVDPSKGKDSFWEELFLLKVNDAYIHEAIAKLSESTLAERAPIINLLFRQCVVAIADPNQIRAANAMQTVGALMSAIFAKEGFKTFSFDVVNVLMGYDNMREQMATFVNSMRHVFSNSGSVAELKDLALCLLIVVVTATKSINKNTLVSVLMDHCIFEDLLKLLDERTERERHGFDVILLLGMLVNYKKPETSPVDGQGVTSVASPSSWKVVQGATDDASMAKRTLYESRRWNAYAEKLEELSDDITLNAIGSVISSSFAEDARAWTSLITVEIKSTTFSSWLAGLLQDDIGEPPKLKIIPSQCGAVLLSLYETIKLNAGFITVITHTQVLQDQVSSSSGTSGSAVETTAPLMPESPESTNFVGTFLTFASFLMHEKDEESAMFIKLCWIILTRICEDDHASEFLHSSEVSVPLYYSKMRHRVAEIKTRQNGSLATALLDLSIEFLISHLMKDLHADLYSLCLGVIHRLLCYQKEKHIRLAFDWKSLWGGLITLASFVVKREQTLLAQHNIFALSNQIVNIFNIFITYGDTFLPDPASYDELYYEVIRVQSTFDSLYDMAKRHGRGVYAESAERLAVDLCNIRAITTHFNPLIRRWKEANQIPSLSPEQVLMVVNENYETLTLKIKGILTYDNYVEEPKDAQSFQNLVTKIMLAHKDVSFKVTAIPVTK